MLSVTDSVICSSFPPLNPSPLNKTLRVTIMGSNGAFDGDGLVALDNVLIKVASSKKSNVTRDDDGDGEAEVEVKKKVS